MIGKIIDASGYFIITDETTNAPLTVTSTAAKGSETPARSIQALTIRIRNGSAYAFSVSTLGYDTITIA